MILQNEREQVIEYGRKMIELGITVGTFGNVSMFNPEENLMAITPSGMDYYKIKPEDIVVLTPDGEKVDGDRKPSSEYDMHRIFYQRRPGINAVIHTHSVYATTLACMHESIKPVHYVVAYAGADVPCIPYVQFGTYELAEALCGSAKEFAAGLRIKQREKFLETNAIDMGSAAGLGHSKSSVKVIQRMIILSK